MASEMMKKSSRLQTRDFQRHPKSSLEQLEQLTLILEQQSSPSTQSFRSLIDILHTAISAVDPTTLWKPVEHRQQQLARVICRLFICLCQYDADGATSDQGKQIIRTILQWLREDSQFFVTKSNSRDLHVSIYSSIEHYALICQNHEEFLNELFSRPKRRKPSPSFRFFHRRKSSPVESLSIIDYSARLVIYLFESSLAHSSLLIHRILSLFLVYLPVSRFATYLVDQTEFYQSLLVQFLNSDHFVECVIHETARSQTDSTDDVFVFTSLIQILAELSLHPSIPMNTSIFIPTLKKLFDALIECGTTIPLWYFLKCLGNFLSRSNESFAREIEENGLISSLINYSIKLNEKPLKLLHQNVLISSLSILYNLCICDSSVLEKESIRQRICSNLFHSENNHLRLLSCLVYCHLSSPSELESDPSCLHLCEQFLSSIRQAFHSSHSIPLITLINGLKHLSMHQQFKERLAKCAEHFQLLFEILRHFHSSIDHQDEVRSLLDTLWFLSFESTCAQIIYHHDTYFALLVQIAEVNPSEDLQRTARGILWQLRQTISHPIPSKSKDEKHIMFSYNHESKELVYRICEHLRQCGYRIWLDIDHMRGSTLESMAHAIEQSFLVILCMTEKYKQSPNCQSEAEYVHRLGKSFLPILLQSKYKPDGWLGFLLGSKFYIDFTKKDFQSNMKKLIEQIELLRQ